MLLGIPQSMTGRGRYKKTVSSKQFSSLGTLHAGRPNAICSDVMAVCTVQIEITESGDRLPTSTATVVESMFI